MNFDFEISRVDYIAFLTLFLFQASDKVDEILTAIETNLQGLEHCDIKGSFPLQSKERLRSICSRIEKILEVG